MLRGCDCCEFVLEGRMSVRIGAVEVLVGKMWR